MANNFRTLLVIGENHKEIAFKYSNDKVVETYIRYYKKDASSIHANYVKSLEVLINKVNQKQKSDVLQLYQEYCKMSDEDFFIMLGEERGFDDNGNIITDENPEAHYMYEKCYEERFKNTGIEAPFSNPFTLKDGSKSYIAKKGDIDWDVVHMSNQDTYKSAWEVCVEHRIPKTDMEKNIYNNMHRRIDYFSKFKSKDEYVAHSCAFWTYGIATENEYIDGCNVDSIVWTTTFYEKFIQPLDDDTLLSIYEIKLLN